MPKMREEKLAKNPELLQDRIWAYKEKTKLCWIDMARKLETNNSTFMSKKSKKIKLTWNREDEKRINPILNKLEREFE